jgi:membrane protein YqaA with SNARE-associated domain
MLIDQLLSAFSLYGLPVLFGALLIGAVGIPMPATMMLLAAGSFVVQGDLNLWWVLALASVAAILGDNVGYCIGRCGGKARNLKSQPEDWRRSATAPSRGVDQALGMGGHLLQPLAGDPVWALGEFSQRRRFVLVAALPFSGRRR